MAEKRISELTAKGSNLQSTDLFEVSVDAGGGLYNTRYITGAQITSAVSSVNIYNANGTLTGNRTVTGGGFSLTFTGQSEFKVVSPSASSLDTAFAVRNNTDTSNHFYIRGDGRIIGVQTFEAVQGINISGGNLNLGNSNFILSGTTGTVEMQAYNSNTIKLNPLGNDVWLTAYNKFLSGGRVQLTNLPTSSAGLSAGDLWNNLGVINIV